MNLPPYASSTRRAVRQSRIPGVFHYHEVHAHFCEKNVGYAFGVKMVVKRHLPPPFRSPRKSSGSHVGLCQ